MPILCRRMVVSASRRGLRGRPKECQLTFGTAHSEPPRRLRPQPRPRRRLDQGLRAEPSGWATVMSRPAEDRAIVDAGLKALAFDSGPPLVCDEPAAISERASDEHGRLGVLGGTNRLQIGDKIRLVPGHCDSTVNLYDWYVGIRANRVEQLWPITAHGAVY